jgi:hypothetical protein
MNTVIHKLKSRLKGTWIHHAVWAYKNPPPKVHDGDDGELVAVNDRNASTTTFGNSRPKGFGSPMSADPRQDKDEDQKDGSHPGADGWGVGFRAGPDRVRDRSGHAAIIHKRLND